MSAGESPGRSSAGNPAQPAAAVDTGSLLSLSGATTASTPAAAAAAGSSRDGARQPQQQPSSAAVEWREDWAIGALSGDAAHSGGPGMLSAGDQPTPASSANGLLQPADAGGSVAASGSGGQPTVDVAAGRLAPVQHLTKEVKTVLAVGDALQVSAIFKGFGVLSSCAACTDAHVLAVAEAVNGARQITANFKP